MISKVDQNVNKNWANFLIKFDDQQLLKIAQSGHTGGN